MTRSRCGRQASPSIENTSLLPISIPHTHVRRPLTVLADPDEVRIVDGQHILAHHRRSYDKGAQIEDAAHIQALVEQKHAARQHRGADRLSHAAPASKTLLIR